MHILASARKYFWGREIFCGTGKRSDKKGKHNIALYVPAQNVQNGQHFNFMVVSVAFSKHIWLAMHFVDYIRESQLCRQNANVLYLQ